MSERSWTAAAAVALGAALAGPWGAVAGEGEDAVLAAQDRRFAATVAADTSALSALTTEDMTYTHSSAKVDTRADFLESLESGRVRYVSIAPEERRVRHYGDAAVVSGTCHVEVDVSGQRVALRLRFTELYVRRGGEWKMALWHSTRVP
jgi:ketosteroid isomerase-like protein